MTAFALILALILVVISVLPAVYHHLLLPQIMHQPPPYTFNINGYIALKTTVTSTTTAIVLLRHCCWDAVSINSNNIVVFLIL